MRTTIAALATVFLSLPAWAQDPCGPRDSIVAFLADQHGEAQQSAGLTGGLMVETYANPQTGSWTIIVTAPSGISCVKAAGTHFERSKLEPAGLRL